MRFMASSVSSLAEHLAEGLYNSNCNDCKSCLEYIKVEDKVLIFMCLKCNKSH